MLRSSLLRLEVIFRIGKITTNKQWPSEVTSLLCLVQFIVTTGTSFRTIVSCIGTNFAPIKETGFLIDRNSIRIPVTHDVDLGSRLLRSFREKISFGDSISSIRFGMNAKDLTAKIIRVGG